MSVSIPRRLDALFGAVAGSAIAVEAIHSTRSHGPAVANLAVCLLLGATLAWWRDAALTSAAAVGVVAVVQSVFLTPLTPLVSALVLVLVPPYAVAAARDLAGAAVGLLVCFTAAISVALATPHGERSMPGLVAAAALAAAAWIAGRALRGRARRASELELLDRRLAELRVARERQAIADERDRVARELHDVVAHAMTVICIQAGAARRTWWNEPEQARGALRATGTVARETLSHLRGALALIDPTAKAPLLDLESIESLAGGARAAGLAIAVDVTGARRPLPAPIGLIAYRVVQEALTNAARHAAPSKVTVRVSYERDVLSVHVRDSGRDRSAEPALEVSGGGNGLRGMRERVEACAGTLSFGPLENGGFAVSARLPLEARK